VLDVCIKGVVVVVTLVVLEGFMHMVVVAAGGAGQKKTGIWLLRMHNGSQTQLLHPLVQMVKGTGGWSSTPLLAQH
jgi:hypothetical protein